MRGNSGFTLIEVIVVAAIIAILAGILTPMIFSQIDDAKNTRAQAECKTISTVILQFRKDAGKWPMYMPTDCNEPLFLTIESGTGNPPLNPGADWQIGSGTRSTKLGTMLNLQKGQQACYNDRAGSYMTEDKPDPWGNKYIVNVINFSSQTAPVWAISAGPNGMLDTGVNDDVLSGDDIGIRIK